MSDATQTTDLERYHVIFPWRHADLIDWTIVGMNHYREGSGRRMMFVAMMRRGHCIKAEGPDDGEVWFRLMAQARHFGSAHG